jgi:hypothetical protein
MAPLTEFTAGNLPADQATALARVLDLQARWECLLADAAGGFTTTDLQGRQRAYEAYRLRRAEYDARYPTGAVPETTLNTPQRVASWCRIIRGVFRRAEGECPSGTVEKVYRLADRIAARMRTDSVPREPVASLADAVRALDAVSTWCDGLVVVPGGLNWQPVTQAAVA